MNQIFVELGLESWKPLLTALLLPPMPWLLLIVLGGVLARQRRIVGASLVLLPLGVVWLGSCTAGAEMIKRSLLPPVTAFDALQIERLKADVAAQRAVAIVVLGGGREELAPEYGRSNLSWQSLERLRYGVWLARRTGAPVAFSGGVGRSDSGAAPEAEVAARIAAEEFGLPLRWVEPRSRDTRENGTRSIDLLAADGIGEIVLVTQAWHMPRALRAFREAASHAGRRVTLHAAPVGLSARVPSGVLRWLPSNEGFDLTRNVVREKLGWWAGA